MMFNISIYEFIMLYKSYQLNCQNNRLTCSTLSLLRPSRMFLLLRLQEFYLKCRNTDICKIWCLNTTHNMLIGYLLKVGNEKLSYIYDFHVRSHRLIYTPDVHRHHHWSEQQPEKKQEKFFKRPKLGKCEIIILVMLFVNI